MGCFLALSKVFSETLRKNRAENVPDGSTQERKFLMEMHAVICLGACRERVE